MKGIQRTIKMINSNQKLASLFNSLILLILLAQFDATVYCQSSSSTTTSRPTTSGDILADVVTTFPTTMTPQTNTSPSPVSAITGEVLLSGNEFVDFTEAPTVLFDGTSNESPNVTIPIVDKNINSTSSPQVPSQNGSSITAQLEPKAAIETTSVPSKNDSNNNNNTEINDTGNATIAEENLTNSTSAEESASVGDGESEETLVGDDETLDDGAKEPNRQTFEPPKNVSQYMDYIERLFHDLRHQITDLFEPHIPQLIRTSQMVELSNSCSYDMLRMALALRQFEPWALRMIDSSGKVPEGIFEGSFTALGSYDECLSTIFATSGSASHSGGGHQQSSSSQQQPISNPTQGKYCLVNVSPFLPPKPPADRVELMFQEEANRRNYTKDDQFSRLSPMFYYMKFRIGVCIPSTCIESDMDSISSALSSSLRLNITIPHCRVKQDQPITRHQLIGGLVFALITLAVISATIMDCWKRKMERIGRKRDNLYVLSVDGSEKSIASADKASLPPMLATKCHFAQTTGKVLAPALSNSTSLIASSSSSLSNFNGRLRKHWSWMSFSLLTNYKLYFAHRQPPSLLVDQEGDQSKGHQKQTETSASIVSCLNGIRVLSLCWVIIANSYITLDPRATKRLTKTRDAPKDFLFQLVAQASLAIETFFFLSGILVSMSFARKLNPKLRDAPGGGSKEADKMGHDKQGKQDTPSYTIQWLHFYVHRYIRMTPATMLVIAFTMFAFRYGDGPLWFEATHKAHMSCSENWWRHLLHVANFIDTRQMCFIHYWYIAADMQLFLFAPILMFLIYQRRRIGYAIAALVGLASITFVFYTTYIRNLPPTLLFYNSDPESRREFGNTIMTKPLTHALPYMVGMLVGKWLTTRQLNGSMPHQQGNRSLATLLGLTATIVALAEVFLPYKWNNSHLPTRFLAALYAALFRFLWSLVLAYLVIACAHRSGRRCRRQQQRQHQSCNHLQPIEHGQPPVNAYCLNCTVRPPLINSQENRHQQLLGSNDGKWIPYGQPPPTIEGRSLNSSVEGLCLCGSGGNLVNRLLSLNIFTHLSKLSFVAYLIHLPLMSVFIAQTRGLFAFSHTLVIHLALSYLVMTFILSFILVHIIEFPFLTFERYLFQRLFYTSNNRSSSTSVAPTPNGDSKMDKSLTGKLNSEKVRIDLSKGAWEPKGFHNKGFCDDDGDKDSAGRGKDYYNHDRMSDKSRRIDNDQTDGLRDINGVDGANFGNDNKMNKDTSYHNNKNDETFKISERL